MQTCEGARVSAAAGEVQIQVLRKGLDIMKITWGIVYAAAKQNAPYWCNSPLLYACSACSRRVIE